jgi:hypothetical protein
VYLPRRFFVINSLDGVLAKILETFKGSNAAVLALHAEELKDATSITRVDGIATFGAIAAVFTAGRRPRARAVMPFFQTAPLL